MIENKSYLGDCFEIMIEIPDKSIDMILCDLPYGKMKCKWDTTIPLETLWKHYKRIMKKTGVVVLTATQPFTSKLVVSNLKMFKYEWIWDKVSPSGYLGAKKRPMSRKESILIFGEKPSYYPQNLIYNPRIKSRNLKCVGSVNYSANYKNHKSSNICEYSGYPTDIIKFKKDKKCFHPTQKPVSLFEYLIKTYTKEGEFVLDNCAGSFTTAIACINTNRKYICIEKEKEYFEKGQARIEKRITERSGDDTFKLDEDEILLKERTENQ